jgi:hypothetical protein
MYGRAPFAVSATSTSSGAVIHTVVSGPAIISGSTVTLTGAGTVMLSANQLASGNYAAATATTSFTVSASFSLTSGSGTVPRPELRPWLRVQRRPTPLPSRLAARQTYPDALTLSATGLPPAQRRPGIAAAAIGRNEVGAQTAATDATPDRAAGHSGPILGCSTGIERLRRKRCCEPDRKKLHRGGDRNLCKHRRT